MTPRRQPSASRFERTASPPPVRNLPPPRRGQSRHHPFDRHKTKGRQVEDAKFIDTLKRYRTQDGDTLLSLSVRSPLLMVFLRHSGCTFCREALADIAKQRDEIESDGTRIVLVHMTTDEEVSEVFGRYGLERLQRISDPQRELYRAFELESGSLRQLLHWRVWWRGFVAGLLKRHGAGRLRGDGRQMPGVFLVSNGVVVKSFRHRTAADRPDYASYTASACFVEEARASKRWIPS